MKTNLFHFHRFNIPVASQYVSFSTRRIIYACRCGKKEMRTEFYEFSDPFPIETTHGCKNWDDEDMKRILNS